MDGEQPSGKWPKQFYLATLVLSIFGLIDAVAAFADVGYVMRQGFSLVEMIWIPVCLLTVVILSKRGQRPWAAIIYPTFHIFIAWLVNFWGVFEPGFQVYPLWLIISSFVFYSVMVYLCWQAYQVIVKTTA